MAVEQDGQGPLSWVASPKTLSHRSVFGADERQRELHIEVDQLPGQLLQMVEALCNLQGFKGWAYQLLADDLSAMFVDGEAVAAAVIEFWAAALADNPHRVGKPLSG